MTKPPPGANTTAPSRKTGVLLVARASRTVESGNPALLPAHEWQRRLGCDAVVQCFREQGMPDLMTAVRQLVERGCDHVMVHPVVPVPDAEWQREVSRLLQEALKLHPGVTFESSGVSSEPRGMPDLVRHRFKQILGGDERLV